LFRNIFIAQMALFISVFKYLHTSQIRKYRFISSYFDETGLIAVSIVEVRQLLESVLALPLFIGVMKKR
jgi:hypothetical protein